MMSGHVIVRLAEVALIVTLVRESSPSTSNTGQSMMLSVVESSVKVIVLNEIVSATVKIASASVIFDTIFSAESVPVMDTFLVRSENAVASVSGGWMDDPINVITVNVPNR